MWVGCGWGRPSDGLPGVQSPCVPAWLHCGGFAGVGGVSVILVGVGWGTGWSCCVMEWDFGFVQGAEEPSIVNQICKELRRRREELSEAIEEMRGEGACFLKMLKSLEDEEAEWLEKLKIAQKKKSAAEKQKLEVDLLLDLHRTLEHAGGLGEWVR